MSSSEDDVSDKISSIAHEIQKRGLTAPAVFVLEMHRPLLNIVHHLGIIFCPYLVPFLGYEKFQNFLKIFSDRKNYESLLNFLESSKEI